jgi:hypothetical protein
VQRIRIGFRSRLLRGKSIIWYHDRVRQGTQSSLLWIWKSFGQPASACRRLFQRLPEPGDTVPQALTDWKRSAAFESWNGCRNCGHFRGNCCAAYPTGIPFLIASGQVDHFVPRPGQVGETVFTEFDFQVWRETGQRVPLRAPEPATPGG